MDGYEARLSIKAKRGTVLSNCNGLDLQGEMLT